MFISDYDARPLSGAHPLAHLWDNGKDPVIQLNELLNIRSSALKNFNEDVIKKGEALSSLQEAFVPIYFLHRFQIEAASKVIGGLEYNYKMKGDTQESMKIVNPSWQKEAIKSFQSVLNVKNLMVPETTLNLLYPRPLGYYNDRELIKGSTGPAFDALAPAEQLSHKVFSILLNPDRLNRLLEYSARDAKNPSPAFLMEALRKTVFEQELENNYERMILYRTQVLYTNHILAALQNEQYARLKPSLLNELSLIEKKLKSYQFRTKHSEQSAFLLYHIDLFKKSPIDFTIDLPEELPPGSPIGMGCR